MKKGISRVFQFLVGLIPLGYPPSDFNRNSTLKQQDQQLVCNYVHKFPESCGPKLDNKSDKQLSKLICQCVTVALTLDTAILFLSGMQTHSQIQALIPSHVCYIVTTRFHVEITITEDKCSCHTW